MLKVAPVVLVRSNVSNIWNNEKWEAAPKNEVGGDEIHLFSENPWMQMSTKRVNKTYWLFLTGSLM